MAEWFFFITLFLAALVVFMLAVRRKNSNKRTDAEESYREQSPLADFLDKID